MPTRPKRWAIPAVSARHTILAVGAVQLTALVALSATEWQRGALTYDFSLFAQASWLIAHGHLDPASSLLGLPFIRNDAELIFWPLALLTVPFGGSPFVLLVVEDAAIVLAGVVALAWAAELLEARVDLVERTRRGLWLLAVLGVAVDPWCFATALFAFHNEAFAGLFTLLAARELWRGARWPFLVWSALLASTGTAGLLECAGIGVAALLVSQRRLLYGALVVVASLCVLEIFMVHGLVAQNGTGVTAGTAFGYLDPGQRHPGVVTLALGAVVHLPAVVHLVLGRLPVAFVFLVPVGLVGAFTRLAIAPVLAVFGPAILATSGLLFRVAAAFQVWPVLLLVLVTSLDVLAGRSGRTTADRRSAARASIGRLGARARLRWPVIWLVGLVTAATATIAEIPAWVPVTPAAAATISRVAARTPAGAEVIASQGIAGRFASRPSLYAVMAAKERFPLRARTVMFVLSPDQGILELRSRQAEAIIASVRRLRGARIVAAQDGITAVVWNPPAGASSIMLPSGSR